jgi:hypothetical protein
MQNYSRRWTLPFAVFVGGSFLAAALFITAKPAASQNAANRKCIGCSVDGKTTPMTSDGHPDFSGYWGGGGNQVDEQFERDKDGSILFDFSLTQGQAPLCVGDACQLPNQPSYTPAYMAKVKEIAKTEFAGTSAMDPMLECKPAGVPRAALNDVQIFQTPQMIAIIHGDYNDRIIYIDGRQHPKDLDYSYNGNSIGHWEGNTLVVDVTGLNDDTWLGGGGFTGQELYTSVHSNKMHVVERWTRDGDVVTYEATVDDPLALTKPWTITPRKFRINKDPEMYLQPYLCEGATAATLQQHYVKPNPEDRDIKNKCNGHRCGALNPGSK